MTMTAGGLAKLIEEMGELQQIAGKKLAYYYTDDHPDGQGSLKERMEDEIGDVMAIMAFVMDSFSLDSDRINQRISSKLKRFKEWDKSEDEIDNKGITSERMMNLTEFDKAVADVIILDYCGDGDPLSVEDCKKVLEDSISDEYGKNALLTIGDTLSAFPISFPCSLIKTACRVAWESIDWELVTSNVNDRLKEIYKD